MNELRLTLDTPGERLDKALAAALADFSRTQIQRLIENGLVAVDGVVAAKVGQKVEGGERVVVRVPPVVPAAIQPEAIPLAIVYEDDDIIVIDKPAGMIVHPSAGHVRGTLAHAVLGHDPEIEGVGGEQRPGIVHRLDKETSGLIVVAKNDRAHRDLQRQFKSRAVEKVYTALVDGAPPTDRGRIETPIGRDPRNRKRMAVVSGDLGREAITEYRVVEKFQAHTLVEARPRTGRTHQIRVHFAFLGCPVAGDTVYGRRHSTIATPRHFLHAARLTLALPSTGGRKVFDAPLPEALQQVLFDLRSRS
ncbi:MAG: RluA family pseudouridine synthase [Chloroflexi bacterium]|nr:RluA family pseudouridine synthase [Chloroflexota bacterium]